MKTIKTGRALLISALTVLWAVSAFAGEASEIKGQVVSLNSQQNSITARVEVLGLSGTEKQDINFTLAEDTQWIICLSGQCVEKTGIDGFNLLGEYTAFEPYGIATKGCRATMHKSDNIITSVRVNIC